MVTFGTDMEFEGRWFQESVLEGNAGYSYSVLARGMKKSVTDCWERFKHVNLDRIQVPLLMALVTFNPGKCNGVLCIYLTIKKLINKVNKLC